MNHSQKLAVSFLVVLSLWMLSGLLVSDEQVSLSKPELANIQSPMRVKVEESVAQEITQELMIQGKLEPLRQVEVKALVSTTVSKLHAAKGAQVEQGQLLAELNMEDRQARVAEATASVAHLTMEVAAAKKLVGKGLNSENLLRSAEADLARAKAALIAAELSVSYTQIKAPFSGVWEERFVELGSHLDVGQRIGLLVDNKVLKAVGFVSQQTVSQLTVGQTVTVKLLDGKEASGQLSYIAKVGEEQTQSFRIEAEIPNDTARLNAGASAQITIQTGSQLAHFVSPSSFSLGKKGEVGIKSVNKEGTVVFYPVSLVRKDINGVWVTGLPASFTLITLGQGFVEEGETVTAVRG